MMTAAKSHCSPQRSSHLLQQVRIEFLTKSSEAVSLTRRQVQTCSYSSSAEPDLKETLKKVIPAKRELFKKVKSHADKKIGDVKVENTIGGMRYGKSTV